MKPKQVKCLEAIYFGRDVVAVLPTGYGKSLIFHLLPSLFYDKLTSLRSASNNHAVVIVVSPLNALIENQIQRSYQGNIKAGISGAALGGGKGGQMPPQIFLLPPQIAPPRWFQFAQTAYGFRQFQNIAYLLSVNISGFTLVLL